MITTKHFLRHRQRGLSLIELLVSMLLGSVIMIAASQVVISSFSSKRLLNAEAELQENARFGMTVIGSMLQKAGGFGCGSSENAGVTSLLNLSETIFNPEQAIEGWDASGTNYGETFIATTNPAMQDTSNSHWVSSTGNSLSIDTSAAINSDIVQVWYNKGEIASVTSVNNSVLTTSDIDLNEGDIITINDCKTITFAQVCDCDTSDDPVCNGTDSRVDTSNCSAPGNKAHTFNELNISTAEIAGLQKALLFVGSVENDQTKTPTLFVSRLGSNARLSEPEEVLSHVESMQILYGEDTTGNYSPNYYVSADAVSDWTNVVSAKVSLLLRSQSNFVLTEKQNITFNGATVQISDGDQHLRRVFSSTVSLRNRNIGY